MKVLFISPYPEEGPSSRFRLVQYFDYLKSCGIKPLFSPFMNKRLYAIRRKFGFIPTLEKAFYFALGIFKRVGDMFLALSCKAIFIHREAFSLGPPVFERLLWFINRNIIFDLDDAIYAAPSSGVDQRRIFRDTQKLAKVVYLSRAVIAGNQYLCDWCLKYNRNVKVIPTCVYVKSLKPKEHAQKNEPVIGWAGNWGNAHYLFSLIGVFTELAQKHNFRLKLVGGADIHEIKIAGVKIDYKDWSLEEEEADIFSFDIGIMPLLGTEFDKGKCGFKIIQYSAFGIPAIASDVGTNRDIIQNGINGFLANTETQWKEDLAGLLSDYSLRNRIGRTARENIVNRFNADSAAGEILRTIREVAGE